MTGSAFRAVAPVSAVCAAFAAQSSAYPPSTRKPDVAPPCRSAAKTKKEIKMSTEFYCEEFPAEKLLQQELVSARKAKNGQWHAITTDPQPKMSESEQMQEMQL